MQLCNRIYYSKVFWRLNMFREAHRSSSGAPNCICSFWFIRPYGDRPLPRQSCILLVFLLSFLFNFVTIWGWVVNATLCPLTPRKTRYPLYRRLGGPQDRSEQVRKTSSAPGFDPRIAQPVESRYTNWVIPAHPMALYDTVLLTLRYQNTTSKFFLRSNMLLELLFRIVINNYNFPIVIVLLININYL
jgi:hypothetical protein